MTILTSLVLLAAFAATVSLASGIASMASDSEIAHRSSVEWMTWRVAFQIAAVLMVLLALSG